MEVTATDFDFLKNVSPSKNITLVVDESHSLGIVGENGEGIFQNIPMENLKRKIMVSLIHYCHHIVKEDSTPFQKIY